jgi:zinc protease
MFFKGTERHGPGEMDRIVKGLGGYLNASTTVESTSYVATVPAEHGPEALHVLADALFHSRYDPLEIDREREVIREEIARKEDNPAGKLFVEFQSRIGAGTPYGRPVLGTWESLGRIDREALREYRRARYGAGNLVLVVAGKLDLEAWAELASPLFDATLTGPRNQVPAFDWQPQPRIAARVERDLRHSYLMLGFRTPGLRDREQAAALELASAVLGRGRSSRLVRRLREELGIVSSISAWTWDLTAGGMLVVSASAEPDREAQVQSEIESAIARLSRDLASAEECARARTVALADFHFANETPADLAATLGQYAVAGRVEEALDYAARLHRTTPEAIRDAARHWLDLEQAVVTIVGPALAHASPPAQSGPGPATARGAR